MILLLALTPLLSACTSAGNGGFKRFLRTNLDCPPPPAHAPGVFKPVWFTEIEWHGRKFLGLDGENYKNLANNGAIAEQAIEALAIQRDHYRDCIRVYNE
jgi:hypothetical protein